MSFLIRRQTDRITLIFGGCVSMPNYFVATFAFGWPTDPVVANILIALPLFEIARLLVRLDHKNSKKVQISQRDNPYQKSRGIQGTMRLLLVISDAA